VILWQQYHEYLTKVGECEQKGGGHHPKQQSLLKGAKVPNEQQEVLILFTISGGHFDI